MAFSIPSSDSRRLASLSENLGLRSTKDLIGQALGLFEQAAIAADDGASLILRYPDGREFEIPLVAATDSKAA